jgi:hypothetical protein
LLTASHVTVRPVAFYKRHIDAWQRGDIDDATFVRRQTGLAWQMAAWIFGTVVVIGVIGLASEGAPVEHLLGVAGLLAFIGVVFGFRLGRWARFGARDRIARKRRADIEARAE